MCLLSTGSLSPSSCADPRVRGERHSHLICSYRCVRRVYLVSRSQTAFTRKAVWLRETRVYHACITCWSEVAYTGICKFVCMYKGLISFHKLPHMHSNTCTARLTSVSTTQPVQQPYSNFTREVNSDPSYMIT